MIRLAPLVALVMALPLASGCAKGDGDVGFSGFGPAGPAGATSEGAEEDTDDAEDTGPEDGASSSQSADGTSGSGDDEGNPLCCEPGPQAGCESVTTESCVCAGLPECCQAVWSSECVDMAIACGDPYCLPAGGSGDEDSGAMPPPLDCDGNFSFSPQNPAPGVPFTATFSDPIGLTWVGMHAEGSGGSSVEGSGPDIAGNGPFSWSYDYAGMAAGVWTFVFTHRQSEDGPDLVRSTCEKQF